MAVTETVNQDVTEVVETQEERIFTQKELDEIIQSRIGKERAKFSDYEELKNKAQRFDEIEEANKSELQKATERADELQSKLDAMTKATEMREMKTQVSIETGVPIHLLTGATLEECKAQAEAILSFAKPAYPSVKDGGEVSTSVTTKAEILAIKNEKARLKAIRENIELFT